MRETDQLKYDMIKYMRKEPNKGIYLSQLRRLHGRILNMSLIGRQYSDIYK